MARRTTVKGFSKRDFLTCAVLRVIVDALREDGQPPKQTELYGGTMEEGEYKGQRSGLVNDFLWGRGRYEQYPYGEAGLPIQLLGYSFGGGRMMVEIMERLENAGHMEPREAGKRKPYMPTEAGLDFVDSLPEDWRQWSL